MQQAHSTRPEAPLCQNLGQKTHPMDRTGPKLSDCRDMCRRAIPLIALKAIVRVLLRHGLHDLVARHLGHDTRSRYARNLAIPFDDIELFGMEVQRIAIEQHNIWVRTAVFERSGHANLERGRNAAGIDLIRLNMRDANRQCSVKYLHGELDRKSVV